MVFSFTDLDLNRLIYITHIMPFPHSPSFMNLQRHPQYFFFLSPALKDLSLHLISCADVEVECLTTDSTLYNTNDLL